MGWINYYVYFKSGHLFGKFRVERSGPRTKELSNDFAIKGIKKLFCIDNVEILSWNEVDDREFKERSKYPLSNEEVEKLCL